MFAYCLNNPVLFADDLGLRAVLRDVTMEDNSKSTKERSKKRNETEKADRRNKKDINNKDPQVVIESKTAAFYNGVLVIKVPSWFSAFPETASFSFGVILMGQKGDVDLLRHEYGHTKQLEELGVWDYCKYVVKPSVSRYKKTTSGAYSWDSYYSTPWEYQADKYGGVTRNYKPWASESSERYWDRVNSLQN